MPTHFRLTKPEFRLCLNQATKGRLQDNIEILGFIGPWNKPTHFLVDGTREPWLISMTEVSIEEGDTGGGDTQSELQWYSVHLIYMGSDRDFLADMIRCWAP